MTENQGFHAYQPAVEKLRDERNMEMKNGKCLKCGSTTVYSLANGVVPGGHVREYIQMDGMYSAADVLSFLCTTCGYYENYVTDAKKLSAVAGKWPQVPHTQP